MHWDYNPDTHTYDFDVPPMSGLCRTYDDTHGQHALIGSGTQVDVVDLLPSPLPIRLPADYVGRHRSTTRRDQK